MRDPLACITQVANGPCGSRLPILNPAAADVAKAAWLPVLSGQAVPKIGEEVFNDDACRPR